MSVVVEFNQRDVAQSIGHLGDGAKAIGLKRAADDVLINDRPFRAGRGQRVAACGGWQPDGLRRRQLPSLCIWMSDLREPTVCTVDVVGRIIQCVGERRQLMGRRIIGKFCLRRRERSRTVGIWLGDLGEPSTGIVHQGCGATCKVADRCQLTAAVRERGVSEEWIRDLGQQARGVRVDGCVSVAVLAGCQIPGAVEIRFQAMLIGQCVCAVEVFDQGGIGGVAHCVQETAASIFFEPKRIARGLDPKNAISLH